MAEKSSSDRTIYTSDPPAEDTGRKLYTAGHFSDSDQEDEASRSVGNGSIGRHAAASGVFSFWAEKKGEYAIFGTGYKRRYFVCHRSLNTITYWETKELALKPDKQPADCAKGQIKPQKMAAVKELVDIVDESGRVFHLTMESEEDARTLLRTFRCDRNEDSRDLVRQKMDADKQAKSEAVVATRQAQLDLAAAASAKPLPSTSVGTNEIAKYQVGAQVANIGGHKVGYVLQIVPQTPGATSGPGIVHIGPTPVAEDVTVYKELLRALVKADGRILQKKRLERAQEKHNISDEQHAQLLGEVTMANEALKTLQQLLQPEGGDKLSALQQTEGLLILGQVATELPTELVAIDLSSARFDPETGKPLRATPGGAATSHVDVPRFDSETGTLLKSGRMRLSTSDYSEDRMSMDQKRQQDAMQASTDSQQSDRVSRGSSDRVSRGSSDRVRLSTLNYSAAPPPPAPADGTPERSSRTDTQDLAETQSLAAARTLRTTSFNEPLRTTSFNKPRNEAADGHDQRHTSALARRSLSVDSAVSPLVHAQASVIVASSQRCILTFRQGSLGINAKISTHPDFKLQFRFFTGTSDAEEQAAGRLVPGMVLTRFNGQDMRGIEYDNVLTFLKARPCEMCFQDTNVMVPTAQAAVVCDDSEDSEDETTSMIRLPTGPSPRSSRLKPDLNAVPEQSSEGGGWISSTDELRVEVENQQVSADAQEQLSSRRLDPVRLSGEITFEEVKAGDLEADVGVQGEDEGGKSHHSLGPGYPEGSERLESRVSTLIYEDEETRDSELCQAEIVERLTVGELIGVGGFADVYEGSYLGAQCAVKILRTTDAALMKKVGVGRALKMQQDDQRVMNALRLEIKTMRHLRHPHIVHFYAAFNYIFRDQELARPCVVMEVRANERAGGCDASVFVRCAMLPYLAA
jgi:hypothetical protein